MHQQLLRCVDVVLGPRVRESVFEPMVADWQRDCGPRLTLTCARWWTATLATFIHCVPRATFGNLPRPFVLDVAGRALALFALAFALQWFLGARLGPASGARAWPPSLATTLPFVVGPAIWFVRRGQIPRHQQRLLVIMLAAAAIVATLLSAQPGWTLGLAYTCMTIWLAFHGWKMVDRERVRGRWIPGLYAAAAMIVGSWPIKLALGISIWKPWWPGDNLIPYIIAMVLGLMSDAPMGEAGYRKMYGHPTSVFESGKRSRNDSTSADR